MPNFGTPDEVTSNTEPRYTLRKLPFWGKNLQDFEWPRQEDLRQLSPDAQI